VILGDYGKGVVSQSLLNTLKKRCREKGIWLSLDPKPVHKLDLRGLSLITPNRKEASEAAGFEIDCPEAAGRAAAKLAEKLGLEAVVVTLDSQGAFLLAGAKSKLVPTKPRSVYDVTGAGDTVLAMLAASLAAGADYETAVQLANVIGGIEVQKFGAAVVTVEEMINEIVAADQGKTGKVQTLDSLVQELEWRKAQGLKVVFTNGCFDIVHTGHIEFLKFCRRQADVVVVGLNSDDSVRSIKGPDRPINNQFDRAAVLSALESVDYVTLFDEPEPLRLIEAVRPDVLVKGQDWAEKGVVGADFVESYGGKVVLAPLVKDKSTTTVIDRIRSKANANGPGRKP
jgi:D-beta-D-heptose 7-phosphate kinase/D-beta-D-heptose 1-phosphate adenosyltransferase